MVLELLEIDIHNLLYYPPGLLDYLAGGTKGFYV